MATYTQQLTFPMNPCCKTPTQTDIMHSENVVSGMTNKVSGMTNVVSGGKRKQKGGSCDQVPSGAHFVYPCWATQQSGNAAEHAWNTRASEVNTQVSGFNIQTGAGIIQKKKATKGAAKKKVTTVPKYRKERPSPSSSATEFKVGTRRKGNDGNFYKVVINKEGVKRWQKIKPTKK